MNRLMEEQEAIMTSLNQEKIGQTLRTIIDRREGDYYIGRTEFDSPEVDQEVLIKHIDQELVPGEFYQVEITSADVFDLYGKIAK